jgi:hypothetical protein
VERLALLRLLPRPAPRGRCDARRAGRLRLRRTGHSDPPGTSAVRPDDPMKDSSLSAEHDDGRTVLRRGRRPTPPTSPSLAGRPRRPEGLSSALRMSGRE